MDKIKSLVKRQDIIFLLIILGLGLIKLWNLDSGFVLGEPDSRNYAAIVKNLSKSPYPYFDGWFFYHGLPLFHYVAFLFSFFVPIKFVALRLVSVLASIAITLSLYFYLRWKVSAEAGFIGALVFSLTPLAVFYSRLGLIETLLVLFTFLAVVLFDAAWAEKSKVLAALAGISLGLGILTKYTAVVIIIIPIIYLFLTLRKAKSRPKLKIHFVPLLTLIFTFLTVLPLASFIYVYNPILFRAGIKEDFGLISSGGVSGLGFYLRNLGYFLSWTVVGLLAVGLSLGLRKLKKNFLIILTLGFYFMLIIFGSKTPEPRYVLIIVPFIAALIGLGIGEFTIKRKINVLVKITALLIFTATILPYSFQAFQSTRHNLIEQAIAYLKEKRKASEWVFSSYWPSAFVDDLGYRVSWVTLSYDDAASLHNELPSYELISDKPPNIFNKEGALIVIEEKYSKRLSKDPARSGLIELIEKTRTPDAVFEETTPNFPFFKEAGNKIKVYEIKP